MKKVYYFIKSVTTRKTIQQHSSDFIHNMSGIMENIKPLLILWITLAFLSGCGRTEQASAPEPVASIVLDAPVELIVPQSSTNPLPGSNGTVFITLDDITGGQVMTTLLLQNGTQIVATRSVLPNDVVAFTVNHHAYKIKLIRLTNILMGEDSALFKLWKNLEIKTAEDFINIVGSKSSTIGIPYLIRFPDGTEMKSEEWFGNQLEFMEVLPN